MAGFHLLTKLAICIKIQFFVTSIFLLLYYIEFLVKPLRSNNTNVSIVNPYVHLLGEDAAAIAYVKVVQSIDK